MYKASLCQCSLEAKGSDSRFAIGDGTADFGWIEAKAHEPRDCEVVSSGIPDRMVSSGVKPTIKHSIVPGQFAQPQASSRQEAVNRCDAETPEWSPPRFRISFQQTTGTEQCRNRSRAVVFSSLRCHTRTISIAYEIASPNLDCVRSHHFYLNR
jgi:hypothetical protein